ncbi:MAG: hypothetical protein HC772_05500 [Leptolyngbyaceae cyanobacterium CRU_2_3]|nr:hypothetical protein [Leptolyngbyaceae cyanobacterium CRU_2_3]
MRDAIDTVDSRYGIHVFNDFIIYNGIPEEYFGDDQDGAIVTYLNVLAYSQSSRIPPQQKTNLIGSLHAAVIPTEA